VINGHHTSEDELVWPEILARKPAMAEALEVFEADHIELHMRLDAVTDQLYGLQVATVERWETARARAIDAAVGMLVCLGDHLDREEVVVWDWVDAHYPADEYADLEKRVMTSEPTKVMKSAVAMVIRGLTPEEYEQLKVDAPKMLLVMHKLFWKRAYAKLSAPLDPR
jgi:hemerythrin-like domain-containing protein